eukprot:1161310-Pelagomonas_calceolata.AAC.2
MQCECASPASDQPGNQAAGLPAKSLQSLASVRQQQQQQALTPHKAAQQDGHRQDALGLQQLQSGVDRRHTSQSANAKGAHHTLECKVWHGM